MTKTGKEKWIIGVTVGITVSIISILFNSFIAKKNDISVIVSEKLKSDTKNEVIKEIIPELDKKVDKDDFENYKKSNEKYQELQYKNLNEKIDLILKGLGIAYKKEKK